MNGHNELEAKIARLETAEKNQELLLRAVEILNAPTGTMDAIRGILLLVKEFSGFEAVGIRLKDGEDFPYYEARGFPTDFVDAERYLCARGPGGGILRDTDGSPILECMCGNVLCGRTDPSLPFFTEHGSFFSNSTTDLLATTTEKDRQSRTRNRCNGEGFESVGLVPLRSGNETIGLLQLNDRRKNMFTPEFTVFHERLGASIGAALARKRAEERARETLSQLQQLNDELESFAYSVSHDLRAPLRRMDGFSRALLQGYGEKIDDQGRHYLERVCAGAQQMGNLIDDLLKLSRVTRSEMTLEHVDLSTIAFRIANELQKTQPGRNAEFVIQKGIKVEGDERLLSAALENLLGNAWKFTSKTEGKTRIEFGAEEREDEKIYFIRDNGAGFDMAYADNLFGAFQRLHRVDEFEGNGIGLATVQRIIHMHGGRVWAKGAVREGATFYFTNPDPMTNDK